MRRCHHAPETMPVNSRNRIRALGVSVVANRHLLNHPTRKLRLQPEGLPTVRKWQTERQGTPRQYAQRYMLAYRYASRQITGRTDEEIVARKSPSERGGANIVAFRTRVVLRSR
jgi:hypothetical protein